jgi:hypothetical protein
MPRQTHVLLAVVYTVAQAACGARTTLDDSDYEGGGGFSGTAGQGAVGNAPSGGTGSGPVGATGGGGVGNTGNVGGVGQGGVAGTAGVAGASGMAGVGGRPEIVAACDNFCAQYVPTCPSEFGTLDTCIASCLNDASTRSAECARLGVAALNCMTGNFVPQLGCNEALFTALNSCADLVEAANACQGDDQPPPQPCASFSYGSDVDCGTTLECPDAYFDAYCYASAPGLVACECSDLRGVSGFEALMPLGYACANALELCGFPY